MDRDPRAATSGLPLWAAAFPIAAAVQLLHKAVDREVLVQLGLRGHDIGQPWYADYATLTRVHLVSGALLTVAGFLQFVPRIRTHHATVHRRVGWVVITAGGVAAVSGIWMNVVFPMGGILKYVGGYFFGVVVLGGVILGVRAMRRGDVFAHRAWMSRAFAVAIAAGIQRLMMSTWLRATGTLDDFVIGLCLWSGAAIALSINELLLRRAVSSLAATSAR